MKIQVNGRGAKVGMAGMRTPASKVAELFIPGYEKGGVNLLKLIGFKEVVSREPLHCIEIGPGRRQSAFFGSSATATQCESHAPVHACRSPRYS